MGASIHASTLALPEGVQFTITDRDFTIATVASPTLIPVEEEAVPAEGEEAVEGEEGAEVTEEGAEGEASAEDKKGEKENKGEKK